MKHYGSVAIAFRYIKKHSIIGRNNRFISQINNFIDIEALTWT